MKRISLLLAVLLLAAPANAQDDDTAVLDIGGDIYRAGQTVSYGIDGADDVFMAGERVTLDADIGGTAHLAGRWVTVEGAVGGALYAAGADVRVAGPVAGNASVFGASVSVGDVAGDLRIGGSEAEIDGTVGGYAIVGSEFLTIDGTVSGDMLVAAREVRFGSGARVEGTLTLYEDEPGTIDVPERVAAAGQVVRREIGEWEIDTDDFSPVSPRALVLRFLGGVLVIAVLAAITGALLPDTLARLRERVLARPIYSIWMGFLGLSTLIGAVVVLAMTLVGLLAAPALILAAGLAGFGGYVVGAYVFGVALLGFAGRELPDSFGDRALAAATGALVAGLIGLIPFLGWLFVLALALAGIGAVVLHWLRPRFYAAD